MEFRSVKELDAHLTMLVRNERKTTQELLVHFNLFEKIQGFAELGYSSMFQYLTRHLGYSDDQGYRRLQAARLLNSNFSVGAKIQDGTLNLTQAAELQKAMVYWEEKNKKPVSEQKLADIIGLIENQSTFNTRKILAEQLQFKPPKPDIVRPQSDQTVRLELSLSSEQFAKLTEVKNLLSHKIPEQKWNQIIEYLCDQVLQESSVHTSKSQKTNGKVKKQALSEKKVIKNSSLSLTPNLMVAVDSLAPLGLPESDQVEMEFPEANSRYVPIEIRRAIFARSQGRCEFVSEDGIRCDCGYKIAYDHIVPYCLGGRSDDLANLRHLCSNHNAMMAKRWGVNHAI